MSLSFSVFKGLFDIWKSRDFDLYFYFQEIYNNALTKLDEYTQMSLKEDIANRRYKALFTPVGFSIENIAIIAGYVKPEYLRMAFTTTTREFHRKHIDLVVEKIKIACSKNIKIDMVDITHDDQKHAEEKIISWIKEMKSRYGLENKNFAIDLTGGTKPMSIGAQNAALSFEDIDALYLKTDYDKDTQQPIPGTEELVKLVKGESLVDKNLVFVIMPFADKYNKVYKWIEETVGSFSGLRCLRADKEIFIGGIMDRIRENIKKAGILIADLTEHNPNVYYELGLCHGYNKMNKTIMLTQDIDKLPFDLKHLAMVIYKSSDKEGFKKQLGERIEHVRSLE